MDTELLAYLAGFIDADGYITVARSRNPTRKSDGRRTFGYCAKIAISQVDDRVPKLAAATFGGRIYTARPTGRTAWFQWHCLGNPAIVAAKLLLPHLRMKHEQAEILLRFDALIRAQAERPLRGLITAEMEKARDNLYIHLRNLNASGDRRRRQIIPSAAIK